MDDSGDCINNERYREPKVIEAVFVDDADEVEESESIGGGKEKIDFIRAVDNIKVGWKAHFLCAFCCAIAVPASIVLLFIASLSTFRTLCCYLIWGSGDLVQLRRWWGAFFASVAITISALVGVVSVKAGILTLITCLSFTGSTATILGKLRVRGLFH